MSNKKRKSKPKYAILEGSKIVRLTSKRPKMFKSKFKVRVGKIA